MKVILLLALVALINSRHVHEAVVGAGGAPGVVGSPAPNMGGSWVGPGGNNPWNTGSNAWGTGSAVGPNRPNPWNTGSTVGPNPWNGGSAIRPNPWNGGNQPNPWNNGNQPNPWNNGNNNNNWNRPQPWGPVSRTTSMNGVTCSNGQLNPASLGRATYGGPTRMTCKNFNGAVAYADICTSLQQCAGLMCAKYIRCPGPISYTAA